MIEGTEDPFTHIKSLDGQQDDSGSRCPLDPAFREFVGNFCADLAKTGVDLILFDDDYRLAFWGGSIACGCEHHRSRVQTILGEEISQKDFHLKVFTGGKNKYRDAYLQVNREALEGFAQHIRKAVENFVESVENL